jgi:hypothetical protein
MRWRRSSINLSVLGVCLLSSGIAVRDALQPSRDAFIMSLWDFCSREGAGTENARLRQRAFFLKKELFQRQTATFSKSREEI